VSDPVGFAKAITNWEMWFDNPARALGELVPGLVLGLATGGAGVAAVRAGTGARRVAGAADELATVAKQMNNAAQVGRRASFGKAASSDYRRTFLDRHPDLEGKVVVHHAVEQQVANRYPGLVSPAELHSYENLRGIPKTVNATLHQSEIRKAWNRFYREHPQPTKDDLLDQATRIDDLHGHEFDPPVR
jgi:hypothetical protein